LAPASTDSREGALVEAGTQMAREGGPETIVLREVARRIGVSPNAAYRHFSGLPDLIDAVAVEARTAMGASMLRETATLRPTGDAGRDALDLVLAVGWGYVHFALREPGLFASAFPTAKPGGHPVPGMRPDEGRNGPDDLLTHTLDAMITAGILAEPDRQAAAVTAWAVVHGLSLLLLGPLAGLPRAEREDLVDTSLRNVARGLIIRD
jgi:AcrR family transcriptional regulator